jgi:ribosome-associated heat shock protein Hsp15
MKTRSLAAKLILDGKVRVNGVRALKVSRPVRLGDVVRGMAARRLFVVHVAGAAERRGSGSIAQSLYVNLTPETPTLASELGSVHARRGPRPTKRDRRRLNAIGSEDA